MCFDSSSLLHPRPDVPELLEHSALFFSQLEQHVATVLRMPALELGAQAHGFERALLDEVLASNRLGPVLYVRSECFMGVSYCNADGHVVTDEKADYSDAESPCTLPSLRSEEEEKKKERKKKFVFQTGQNKRTKKQKQ